MPHTFGGDWTDDKLEVARRYFSAYATALKKQPFQKWYVDAFAGTGERMEAQAGEQSSLLLDDESEGRTRVKPGSVRIALEIDPPFNRYIFIDRAKAHVAALENLRSEFPKRCIDIVPADANEVLQSLCGSTDWRRTRAAIFIDPYGMQVNWATLEALATTKAVDLGLLFPTGPLNRMLSTDGDIPEEWQQRIDEHLGPCNWRSAFYTTVPDLDLFAGPTIKSKRNVSLGGLRLFVFDRLKSIFPHVCETPLEMKNSRGVTLYHLFIICANPSEKAGRLAMRLAKSAVKLSRRLVR